MAREIKIIGLEGIPEVGPGDELAPLILNSAHSQGVELENGDILVITQKIVSKAEGRLVNLDEVIPSPFAEIVARGCRKDPRHVEVILRESKRIVRMAPHVLIMETHQGFVCANAGVDSSNIASDGVVSLLPNDPDASAAKIHAEMEKRAGVRVAVIISDSFGRPWREGLTNVAIGVAGLKALKDYRGKRDAHGYVLRSSVIAIADELASAAELAIGKLERVPAAIIRGYKYPSGRGSVKELLRDPNKDLFR